MRTGNNVPISRSRLFIGILTAGLAAIGLVLLTGAGRTGIAEAQISAAGSEGWSRREAAALLSYIDDLSREGVSPGIIDTAPLRQALADKAPAAIDQTAGELFSALARGQALGFSPPALRGRWAIADNTISEEELKTVAAHALAKGDIGTVLRQFEPVHPQYRQLKEAYLHTPDTDKDARGKLALNMERWRWMPRDLGENYILVNIPAYEIRVVRQGAIQYHGRVIVGTTTKRTPIFAATGTGVIINPTWYVPTSIVRESVGALLAQRPEMAERQGYYMTPEGGVRQKPGPGNALGQMKIVMPNVYSVFIHDTPNKELFGRNVRAMSHGCIRAENALELARNLLEPGWTAEMIGETVKTGKTTQIDFEDTLPVYIAYFTAYADEEGSVSYYPDIYGYDAEALQLMKAAAPDALTAMAESGAEDQETGCAAAGL